MNFGTFAAALLDPAAPLPPGLVDGPGVPAATRYAVHRNNVLAGCAEALAANFPVVRRLLGAACFDLLACQHVRASPPTSPCLSRYGAGYADTLAACASLSPWPYLADVARLEYARVLAFQAADAQPCAAQHLATLAADPARLATARWTLHPSLQVLDSPWSAASLWQAHQGEGDDDAAIAAIDWRCPQGAWVLRDGDDVLVLATEPAAARFAARLQAGGTLAEAAAQAGPGFDVSTALARLIRHGAVTAVDPPPVDTQPHREHA
jgi:hypothetical protein